MVKNKKSQDEAVSTIVSYVIISGILSIIMIITFLSANHVFVDAPRGQITYYHFIDIGNGVSTRMMDIFAAAPQNGVMDVVFDLPDEVAGQDYYVNVTGEDWTQTITLSQDNVMVNITLLGIGGSKNISGNTYGSAMNRLVYNSSMG